MKLYKLIKNLNCRVLGNVNLEISGVYHNDKLVRHAGLFFCINGTKSSGEKFVQIAIKNGAVAIVTESELKGLQITQVIVGDVRSAMSLISATFYGNPAKSLNLVGVTGTNGKTSITYILKSMFESCGKRCAIIGTNGIVFENNVIETGMTTPDPIELHKIFSMLLKNGIKNIFIEVSAHALDLRKLDGIIFDAMIFTNLTEDHLDYFRDIETYFKAKEKAFYQNRTKLSILNIDYEYGMRLLSSIKTKVLTYSTNDDASVVAEKINIENNHQCFEINGVKFTSKLLGKFNVSNIISCVCYLKYIGFELRKIAELVALIDPVPGRFNSYNIKGRTFIIDYAHTPDGLENVLKLCQSIKRKDKKLVCVFGCGGNRETQKRKIMGEISSKLADFVIITSDNPRYEQRADIARDIEQGVVSQNYKIILDRALAIRFAYEISNIEDIVLIAGKGEENYIDEQGEKLPYSDREEVLKLRNNND